MKTMLSNTSVQYVKGVGPAKAKLFLNLGIENIEDLLYFFPRRYQDRRDVTKLAAVKIGEFQAVTGEVVSVDSKKSWHTKKHLTEVIIDDKSGRLVLVWFNQPFVDRYFKVGKHTVCFGKVDLYKDRLQMVSPEYETFDSDDDNSLSINCIVPIYPLTRGMTQRFLRRIVRAALDKHKDSLFDELPVALRNKLKLANIKRSIETIHFPNDLSDQEDAMKRISFEEFYFFQIAIILRRLSIVQKQGFGHKADVFSEEEFSNSFEFNLTDAQRRVIVEISSDMQKKEPMMRLLQGDVGSGKTLVALFGCELAAKNGYQSAIMAPTEILARQHYDNIVRMVEAGILKNVKPALLISGLKKAVKEGLYRQIENGDVNLVVGTHALISEAVNFKNLSYVVIDEQHKFWSSSACIVKRKRNKSRCSYNDRDSNTKNIMYNALRRYGCFCYRSNAFWTWEN
ncbi:MAG: DEAD/DEAH box helicase [Candidatus Zapsychrus exili]|nr:DEAD/DEAH box helicase [Candidatus Zapsychrus exili]